LGPVDQRCVAALGIVAQNNEMSMFGEVIAA
jgi:hypothetical protein